jgi:L-xylulokinase
MGVHKQGQTGVIAGWSAPVEAVMETATIDKRMRTWRGVHLVPGHWVLESNAGEAGAAYRWAKDMLAPGLTDAGVARIAANAPIGANGALAFLGPRAADMGHVGAQWGGLVFPLLSTVAPVERAHLLRAALENLGFAIAANLRQINEISGVDPSTIAFGGGMSRNSLLTQMLADVTAKPVLVSRTPEVSALGAAMCAVTGLGIFGSLPEASEAMRGKARTRVPDPVSSLEYEELFERWTTVGRGLHSMNEVL